MRSFLIPLLPLALAGCKNEPVAVGAFRFEKVLDTTKRPNQFEDGTIDLAYIPGSSGEYLLLYRDGLIEHRDASHAIVSSRKLSVRQRNECGGLAITVDPQFEENKLVYVGYCVVDGDVVLRSFPWDPTRPEALPDDELTHINAWEAGVNHYHNLGDMGWDGSYLWLTYGDGNRNASFPQDTLDLRGKLLRIDPYRDGTPGYRIPPDNPFIGNAEIADEIVAWGLKSSFRASFSNGTWFLGEVGLDNWEEINIVTLNDPRPNLGYITCEGPATLDDEFVITDEPCVLESTPDYHPPAIFYPHDPDHAVVTDDPDGESSSTTGFAVTGGVLYEGDQYNGQMSGWYIYSDNQRHFIRRARFVDGALTDDEHFGHVEDVWSWLIGPDGLIYALTPGKLYRLVLDVPDA